jgi:hypothetical protein
MSSMSGPIDNHSKGKSCAILGCREIATMQCPKCENYYCYLHTKAHVHKMTGKEKKEWTKDQESLR